jgi:hypothetical protein
MRAYRVWRWLAWGTVGGAGLACHDAEGIPTQQGPLAGLRYVNVVSDTGPLDIRIVDIVGDAPATFGASFRTGGSPIGQAAQTSPPYQAVAAGLRHIKVFNSSTDPAIAQQVHVDTTFTFEADRDYDFFVVGFSRPGHVPARHAVIAPTPTAPTMGPGQFAIRVVNLAPSLAGALPAPTDTTVAPDAFVRVGSAPPSGTPQATNVPYLAASQYAVLDTGQYRLALTVTAATGPALLLSPVPPGLPGSNPVAGSSVAGSVLTAAIVPRSVVGSGAPQGGSPTARAVELVTRSNDTITVQSGSVSTLTNRSPAKPDSAVGTTGTGATTGAAAGNIVLMSGVTEPEYDVWQVVTQVVDSLSCVPVDPTDTPTKCGATNAVATTRFRFRSRIAGTPTSPATGTPVYQIYTAATADYTIPSIMYLVDKRP